ncbi:MAG: hypothetical protein AAFV92_07435, partial [Pseudomonadota bacterium]
VKALSRTDPHQNRGSARVRQETILQPQAHSPTRRHNPRFLSDARRAAVLVRVCPAEGFDDRLRRMTQGV